MCKRTRPEKPSGDDDRPVDDMVHHPLSEVLHRDQRTTLHRNNSEVVLDCRGNSRTSDSNHNYCALIVDCNSSSSSSSSCAGGVTSVSSISGGAVSSFKHDTEDLTPRTLRTLNSTESQVGNAGFRRTRWERSIVTWLILIVAVSGLGGLLFAALLTVTAVQSAPVVPTAAMMMALQDKRWSSQPKWINPCGYMAVDFGESGDFMQLSNEMLLDNIVTQAKTALNHALAYRDDYIRKTFNTDFVDFHLTWKGNRYDWLPSHERIPKQLGEPLDKEYLDKLEVRMLNTLLVDSYEFMQMYAVGLEQISWDQYDYRRMFGRDNFFDQFDRTEDYLKTILCEIQVAQIELNVSPKPDVGRDAMPSQYRNISSNESFRDLRDWLIFRDYMNALEYVIQVFEYLKQVIES